MIQDYRQLKKKGARNKLFAVLAIVAVIILALVINNIYLEVLQYEEIGKLSSIYTTNLVYKVVFSAAGFIVIFALFTVSGLFVRRNLGKYLLENSLPSKKLPVYSISVAAAFIGALACRNFFYQKALNFMNATPFGKVDPIFSHDIGYYIFQRPFLMSIYDFFSTVWLLVIIFTAMYYLISLFITHSGALTLQNLKVKSIIRHNLINIAVFFIIKVFSYKFQMEGLLYNTVVNVRGAGYVDVNIWSRYFKIAPFLIITIVIAALVFIWKGKLKRAALAIAVFPALWVVVLIISGVVQAFVVKPNEINLENPYLKYNMEKTREAYNIDRIKTEEFPQMRDLSPDIINRNTDTINNIRIVDYKATLDSDTQLQSNTNFYSFHDGDIINYTINGKEIPIFIAAREIDRNRLPDKSYVNTTYKYTHGYGVVINPINRLTPEGQVDFILSGLRMDSEDKNLKITEPRIYYGEMTKDYVIVNAANNLNEIDYDGNRETNYAGQGGISMNLLNRTLFALKYGDLNMIISGYVSGNSRLLLNREIIQRAQKAVPFLTVDSDPYILLTSDGRLKWVLDAYTTSEFYPYSQNAGDYGNFNYIRNSVKIVIDAYDGKVKYYAIDKNDPVIKTYSRIYPGIFSEDPLPADIAAHMRYPEMLFKIQTDILKRYHLDPNANPQNVSMFYSNQDMWDIAKYPSHNENEDVKEIEPYYNMVRLPGKQGQTEELILMRPFTPSNKNNMISWLAVRNSFDKYGELIFYTFPKNTNIYGPYQVEVKINQIDKISKDMTLWGQSGSKVFKGNLLVIPIEDSVLYVEPIYIQSSGPSSIPEVREIVVGYQKGEEFKYGIGTNFQEALGQLFTGIAPGLGTDAQKAQENVQTNIDRKMLDDLVSKYDQLRQQLDDLGKLIDALKAGNR